jgi:dTDP-glucose 4,6-dehydratase
VNRAVVTGGAGFLGSHLCDALLARGDEVVCVDDLSTGRRAHVAHLFGRPGFTFLEQDVSERLEVPGPVDAVLHLASPASPPDYLRLPLETLAVGSNGTRNALELSRRTGARLLFTSTSEVYGDPTVHPQNESYWGNVNPVGPRSVYDEAKRFSEAMISAYHREHGLDTRIVRTFNTYGPRLRPDDGRVVSNFLAQALTGRPLTVYGDGSQTRSFCYVDDLIRGLLALLDAPTGPDVHGPVNLGNPVEHTMLELAELVVEVTGHEVPIEHAQLPEDDPTQRRPDIDRAEQLLGWRPEVSLRDGLARTADHFRDQLREAA